jgi:hypothetical protein
VWGECSRDTPEAVAESFYEPNRPPAHIECARAAIKIIASRISSV